MCSLPGNLNSTCKGGDVMACPVQEINVKGLRITHFEQLYIYLVWAEQTGCYYGQKRYFDKRYEDLKCWLDDVINTYKMEML